MQSYDAALGLISTLRAVFGSEHRPLAECTGRTLATDIVAKLPSPPFTNSAMDGFAVRLADCKDPLRIAGTVFAKALSESEIPAYSEGACVRIMTGAVLPEWADTVIPVEQATQSGETVTFKSLPELGSNIRIKGTDVEPGTLLLKAGAKLDPERLMIAAAFGYPELEVVQKPRILLLATGDELHEPGEPLPLGGIYNSSRYFLTAAVEALGLAVDAFETIPDNPDAAKRAIERLLGFDQRPTLILTTGAVSAGEKDFVPQVACALGFTAKFHKVAIRPGKPVFLAARRGPDLSHGPDKSEQEAHAVWLGLPGNPISTCVGWHFFARPLLSAWAGLPPAERRTVRLKTPVTKPEGLRCFFRAEVNGEYAWTSRSQGSAELAPSINVEAYVDLPEGIARIPAETKVEALFV